MSFASKYRGKELTVMVKLLSVFGVVEVRQMRELFSHLDTKKYGKIMENRLRAGEFPNLSEDYPQGQAPAVEACKSFMDFANGLRNGAPVQAAAAKEPEKKKKGLFGFFR